MLNTKTTLLALVWLFLFVCLLEGKAQTVEAVLPALREGLKPIPIPATEGIEAEVHNFLLAEQQTLARTKPTEMQISEAYGRLGQVYHAYAFLASASACYENAQLLAPKDFRWPYLLGSLALQARRDNEALLAFQLVQKLQPSYLAAWVNAGNIYLHQNQLAEAEAAFTTAIKRDENCAAAHYGLGQVALARRAYPAALNELERALVAAPSANRIHYALAMAHRGLNNLAQAAAHLKLQGSVGVRAADPLIDGLQQFVRGERMHLLQGYNALEAKRYVEAVAAYTLAIKANPANVTALVNLGIALEQLGNTEAASQHFAEALRLAPDNSTAHANLGFLLVKEQRYALALSHLRAVLAQTPKDTETRYQLAQSLLKLGQQQAAMTEFELVISDDPANEDALLQWATIAYQQKNYETVLARLTQAQELFPQKGRTAALLAFTLATVPDLKLRNGARALELARPIYQTTGAIEHGAILAFALAESGDCAAATSLQRRLIAAAERSQQTALVTKLKTELPLFEQTGNCRPGHQVSAQRH